MLLTQHFLALAAGDTPRCGSCRQTGHSQAWFRPEPILYFRRSRVRQTRRGLSGLALSQLLLTQKTRAVAELVFCAATNFPFPFVQQCNAQRNQNRPLVAGKSDDCTAHFSSAEKNLKGWKCLIFCGCKVLGGSRRNGHCEPQRRAAHTLCAHPRCSAWRHLLVCYPNGNHCFLRQFSRSTTDCWFSGTSSADIAAFSQIAIPSMSQIHVAALLLPSFSSKRKQSKKRIRAL